MNALKDYSSMAYILAHTDEEIAQVHEDTTTLGSPAFTDAARQSEPAVRRNANYHCH